MFIFMKSKKGFTLVELMIVVVIMAILVAVAVPIFSAVTKNARIKTCAANRREIVSQVNGLLMGNVDGSQHTAGGGFKIESNGKAGTLTLDGTQGDPIYTVDNFKSLFQDVPYCPAANDTEKATYTVTITAASATGDQETTAKVSVVCDGGTDGAGVHV